jgi:uncharacterized protein (TIGR03382 family)
MGFHCGASGTAMPALALLWALALLRRRSVARRQPVD